MSDRSRDGKKPFTFWFDIELKEALKERANLMNTTTTDLLNRAVKFYIEKGYLDGEEGSQKVSSSIIARDIQAMSKYEEELSAIASQIRGIQSSMKDLEKQTNNLERRLNEDPIPTQAELRPYIQNVVGTYFSSQLAPILQKINEALNKIEE